VNRVVSTLLGALVALAAWEVLGRVHALGETWPPFSAVFAYIVAPEHHALLLDAVERTATEALIGLCIGSGAGIALASIAALIPAAADGLGAFASLVNGIPVVAVAGICVLTLPRDATPLVVAALAVGFIVFVGAAAGFGAATAAHRDLFDVLGASRLATFRRLFVPSALPAIVDALRSAAPLAVVGAIIGEWFAAERGLGPMLIAAMQNFAVDQLWAVALLSALLSIAGYTVLGAVRAAVTERFAP
jgi:ABC-type nitrate/sulfonate/bicarbonate transport system permease component